MGSQAPSVELAANQGCMIRGARAVITASSTEVTVPSTNVWLGVANTSEEADAAGCIRRPMVGSQMGTDLICRKAPLCATQYSITFVGPLALPGVSVTWSFEGARNMSYHWTLAQRNNNDMQFRFRFERCESSSVCEAGNDSQAAWLTMDSGVDKYASWSVTSLLNITDLPFSKCQENQVRSALAFAHNVDANQVAISDLSQTDVKGHANATDLGVKYTVLNLALLPQFLQIGSDSNDNGTVFVNSTVQASVKQAVQMGDAFVKAEGARVQQEMLQYQNNPEELIEKFHAVFPKSLRLKNAPGPKINFSTTSQDMRQSGPVYEAMYNKAATVGVKVPNSLNLSSFSPLLQVCGSAQVITANSTWSARLVSIRGQQALKGAWSAFMGVPNTSVMIEKISQESQVIARRLADNSAISPTVIHFATEAADSADAQRMRSLLVRYSKKPSLSDFEGAVDHNMDSASYANIQLVLKYAKPLEDSAFVRTIVPAFYTMPLLESAEAASKRPATLKNSDGGGSGLPSWLVVVCLPLLLVLCCTLAAGALLVMRRRADSRGTKTRSVGGDFPKGEYTAMDMETCQALPNGHNEAWDAAYVDRPPEPRYGQGQMHAGEAPPGGRPSLWRYRPQNEASMGIRALPDIEAAMTKYCMQPGEAFEVSEERPGPAGVTFLRLADGRGWLFDRKPGVGTMCAPEGQGGARELTAGQQQLLPEAAGFEAGGAPANSKAASRLREVMPPPAHLQLPGPLIPGLTGSSSQLGTQAFDRSFSTVVTGVNTGGAIPFPMPAASGPPGMGRSPGSVAAIPTVALVR